MRRLLLMVLLIAFVGALLATVLPSSATDQTFSTHIDNPYFPLTPGDVYRYTGGEDRQSALDVMEVTRRTKVIAGVTTTWGAGRARRASSMATVRGTTTSAQARTIPYSSFARSSFGSVPSRTHPTATRSSSRSNVAATTSANRSIAIRPCAAARP